jgi:hypothetical protein
MLKGMSRIQMGCFTWWLMSEAMSWMQAGSLGKE